MNGIPELLRAKTWSQPPRGRGAGHRATSRAPRPPRCPLPFRPAANTSRFLSGPTHLLPPPITSHSFSSSTPTPSLAAVSSSRRQPRNLESTASEAPACFPTRFDERAFFPWASFLFSSTITSQEAPPSRTPRTISTRTSTSTATPPSSEASSLRPLHRPKPCPSSDDHSTHPPPHSHFLPSRRTTRFL